MKIEATLLAAALPLLAAAGDCRPETWFHIIGGNASKAGLTADLEALSAAGFGGIQLFHGQYGKAEAWDGVAEQIPCLSAKWDDLVTHAANECSRLGMTFKMQNCPGWSMSGGPWIATSNAMRKLVYARRDVIGAVPEIPVPPEFRDADSDWRDVCHLAFPTPDGDSGDGALVPCAVETNGNVRTFRFDSPVAVRTLELPSPSQLNHGWSYNPDTRVLLEAEESGGWRTVCDVKYPQGCWQDVVPFSLACGDAASKTWRLSLSSPHKFALPFVRLHSGARLDNWEGLAGHVLRGQLKRQYPRQNPAAYIPRGTVRVVRPGETLPESPVGGQNAGRPAKWTVLRVGHVNMKKVNAPAPKEATGWECDKLDPHGIEANFAGYIGRLVDGPLGGGKLKGMIVDSWECERQTWTWRMEEWFRAANGYDVKEMLPAVFGWVIGSPAETEVKLLDWRRTVSGLVTKNYYGRMAELAHAKGLTVAYETAFGDVVPGDILEYWKWCDTPMCEFWQPYTPDIGFVGHPNFKPVRPCVSAAHLYGKRRVDCESFTSMRLTWDENFRDLKEQAVRHFARGVTHFVFHTCTHNPQTDGRVPGTSFGTFIGTPFIRGQTWWPFMRPFAEWTSKCCAFLERGLPVVDVLRYLGDELDHKPDELEYFPDGFKNDYLNADALFNRLDVKDGRFVLPDGMSYSAVWVPDSVLVLPRTRARLDALAARGGRVVYGSADASVAGLKPQVVSDAPLLWYHRVDGDADCFFAAANEKGFAGKATFRTLHGEKELTLNLAPYETLLLEFGKDGMRNLASTPNSQLPTRNSQLPTPNSQLPTRNSQLPTRNSQLQITSWTLSFPPGWGTPESIALDSLVPWKDLPGVSEEGRAFSGTATYATTVSLAAKPEGALRLDLGDVRDFARVFVNGREAAVLWAKPYSCDIAPFARKGENEIKVEVTSTWFNRLAYDFGQPPEKRKTWTVWNIGGTTPPCLKPKADLRPSGLLGPVGLLLPGIRSMTPVSRENEPSWRERHQQKLAEIAACSNRSYDVVFVGDAITELWERRHRNRWNHWFAYGKLRALNLGFAGDRTEHVLWRLENGELDGYSAKAVVLMVGTNNSGQLSPEDEPPADTIMGVKKVMNVVRAKQPNARLVLMAIFPRGKDADDPVRRRNEVVNRELGKLCDDHSSIWANVNRRFLTADGRLSRRVMPDLLHPSDEGYDIWASAIMPLLREVCLAPSGRNTPYPKMLPDCIPDWEWTDRPAEAVGDTRISGQTRRREEGPFGDWWWLNRLHNRRLQVLSARGKTVDVVLMGDSITHFWEWRHPKSWAKFTGRYSAINCGYGGDRTQDVIWRAENGELDGFRAKAVVLEIGTNNSTLGSRAEDTAEGIRECIAAIRRRQPTAKVVLHPIFPRGHDTAKSRVAHERARAVNEQVNAIVKSYADGKDVVWVDFNDKWLPDGWGVPSALMPDAIHPSDEGYDLWMSALNPVLDRICGRK